MSSPPTLTELARLIREGATMSDFITGKWCTVRTGRPKACAMGAAFFAAHPNWKTTIESGNLNFAASQWCTGGVFDMVIPYPKLYDSQVARRGQVRTVIQHLNDDCGWSREKIADFLECCDERE